MRYDRRVKGATVPDPNRPPTAKHLLSREEYANYRNVRAVAWLFTIVGPLLVLGGLAAALGLERKKDDPPAAVMVAVAAVGLCGVVGGIATLLRRRSLAPLIKVMACVYLLGFPIGTILGVAVLRGLGGYLDSVDEIEAARRRAG